MPLSPDHNAERLAKLKELMPDIFTNEGKLNINELKKVVDPGLVNETERYEFRWFGKSQAKREAFTPTDATLVYDEERSVNPENSENIIIEGENLAVLKLLSKAYREKVKCIYIDPPYNTGKDFVYTDKWNQDKAEYWEDAEYVENGMKVDTNAETDGRFHSNWLNMMYSRLLIARQLLKEDGVIFISIDDNEVHHLRKLCDEVFGEENFVVQIIWKKRNTPPNDQIIGTQHDYILAFAKNKEQLKLYPKPRTEEQLSKFKNPDNHPKGVWTSGDLSANVKGGRYSKALDFEIFNPNTQKSYKSPTGNWRFNKDRIDSLLNSGEIHFGKNGDTAPKLKRFLADLKNGITWSSIWDFVPFNTSGSSEMTDIFGNSTIFESPKPSGLLKEIVRLTTDSEDLLLDFFAGSGSLLDGVQKMNYEDNGNRIVILVQLPETTDLKSEAYKAGYKKISDITIERNKRVVEKIIEEKKAEQPDLFTNDEKEDSLNGLGFKVFKLQKSNFPRTEFAPDPDMTEEENIELLKRYISIKEAQMVTAFNKDELITEILIKKGYELNHTITKKEEFKKNELFHVTDGIKETLICLDGSLDRETVEYFKKNTKENLIVLERALDTTKKWNLKHYMGDNFVAF